MRDHTSNSALILFFFCEGHPRRSIVSIIFVDKFKSFPSLFFSNFLSPISLIAAHLCGSFLFLNNIHWSKYYSFQLIVNKHTNKSLSLNGGVPDKDFLACSDSLRNIFFGPPAVLCNIQAQLDSRCRHVFHRTGSCRAFLRTCHLNSGRLLSSDWCRCT